MTITENTKTWTDYAEAAVYADDAPRYLSEWDIYVAPCDGPDGQYCVLTTDYDGCGRCLGWGCYRCTYVTCTTHE